MKVKGKIDDKKLDPLFRKLINNSKDLSRPLDKILAVTLSSIEQNFQSQGRPKKWQGLKASTKRKRGLEGKWPGKILSVSGQLASSVNGRVDGNAVLVGSNKKQARIMNQGGTIKHPGGTRFRFIGKGKVRFLTRGQSLAGFSGITKPHDIKIPARPFLLFQDKDIDKAEKILAKHLLEGV